MIYRRKAPKILRFECDAPVLTPVLSYNKGLLKELFGDHLQERWLTLKRAWVYAQDWRCKLYTDEGVIAFIVKRGAITDFNSIPAVLESIFKRDDRKGFVAGLTHDAGFALQALSFQTTNDFFYQLHRLEGSGRFKSWIKWRAVNSCFAKKVWDEGVPSYESRWYTMLWTDK